MYQFLITFLLYIFQTHFLLAIEDEIDGMLARNVFNLSAAEIVMHSQIAYIFVADYRYHALPYAASCHNARLFELYLIEEATLKGFVQILSKIRRGYKYALELFKLLKNYVLSYINLNL